MPDRLTAGRQFLVLFVVVRIHLGQQTLQKYCKVFLFSAIFTIMKTLYLIRHAKSSWKLPELEDFDRPLNNRGLQNAPFMGKWMRKAGVLPDLIISSPAVRTLKTAELLAFEMGYQRENIKLYSDLYDASAATIRKIISTQDDTMKSLAIVGHNDGLSILAENLSSNFSHSIPTCGVVTLVFQCNFWHEISPKVNTQTYFDFPKKFLV